MASCGKLVKVYGKRWGNISDALGTAYSALGEHQTITANQTYVDLSSSTISFTTSVTNSVFLLQADLNVYISTDNGNGTGAAFKWNGNKICGTDGGSGDTWQRMGHGNSGNAGSWGVVRKLVYSPGLAAGSSVSANVMVGQWGSNNSVINYSGYSNYSDFIIMEFEPT
jgi:hypothetical protein